MAALYAHARTLPIEWRFASPVTGLAPQDQAIWHIRVDGGDDVAATAVIVAAGGFSNDPAMLSEQLPPLSGDGRYLRGGAPQATGAGHRLLRAAGAAFDALDAICLYPIGTPHPDDPTATRGVSIVGITNLWLNTDGLRFHDESRRGMADTPALVTQPGATSWGVFDKHEVDRIVVGGDANYKAEYEHGAVDMTPKVRAFIERSSFVRCAATLEDLALAADLPVEAAVASVRRFNELIASGAERDDFGRDLRGLRPIAEPPFYAIQYFPWVQKCLGGARTDLACRVLRPDGSVIPGLFAAGEVAGMAGGHINGRGVLEGTMIAPSLFAGRVAARSIHEARL
jgi:predicted oxidoreductase